jgi:hypothetical protein
MAKFFRKVLGGDVASTRMQSNVGQAVDTMLKSPLVEGRLIENVALTTAAINVEHKLGRKLQGYMVVQQNAGFIVFDAIVATTDTALYLPLKATGVCTVSLWVF